MSILLFILLVSSLNYSLVNSLCYTCVPIGGRCNDLANNECYSNAYCDSEGICRPKLSLGESCTSRSQCNTFSCHNGTCQYTRYLGVGEKCTDDIQCHEHDICKEGRCFNPNYPSCSSDVNCPIGKLCNYNSSCVDILPPGSNCLNDGECLEYESCTPDDKGQFTCQNLYSIDNGGNCTYAFQCKFGLDCKSGYCSDIPNPSTCLHYQNLCPGAYATCMCDENSNSTGSCKPIFVNSDRCESLASDLQICRAKYCPNSPIEINPGSCIYKNCYTTALDFYRDCYVYTCGNPYYYTFELSSTTRSESNSIVILLLISIFLINL